MITEVANAGKANVFSKVAEGGKNVVNKVKEFVKDPNVQRKALAVTLGLAAAAIGTYAVMNYGHAMDHPTILNRPETIKGTLLTLGSTASLIGSIVAGTKGRGD